MKCCCVLGNDCQRPAHPDSGEAMLCKDCLTDPEHFTANQQPKRLPPRTVAVVGDLL